MYIFKIIDNNKIIIFRCLEIMIKFGVWKRKGFFYGDVSVPDFGIDNFDIFIPKTDGYLSRQLFTHAIIIYFFATIHIFMHLSKQLELVQLSANSFLARIEPIALRQ